jgi:hypothetical protein
VNPVIVALALAVIVAVVAVAAKRLRHSRRERALRAQPGASLGNPIAVRSFDEMDLYLARWECGCGARPGLAGEGSREIGERRFRVARLRCPACEDDWFVYFDTTDLLQ